MTKIDPHGTASDEPAALAVSQHETMSGCNATACLERRGFSVQAFETSGLGGRTMESRIRQGAFRGVLDLATTELASELLGGTCGAGAERLTAAAIQRIPQVICVGGLDLASFGPIETLPPRLSGRLVHVWSQNLTFVRTNPEENDLLGKEIAHKASAARAATAVLLALRGLSSLDAPGQPFWQPETNAVLFQSLRNWMSPSVELIELDFHINDPGFAESAAAKLLEYLSK